MDEKKLEKMISYVTEIALRLLVAVGKNIGLFFAWMFIEMAGSISEDDVTTISVLLGFSALLMTMTVQRWDWDGLERLIRTFVIPQKKVK